MSRRYTVKRDASLLNYLYEIFPEQSRTGVKSYLTNGRVLVDGRKVRAHDWPLREGSVIEILSKGQSVGDEMVDKASDTVKTAGIKIIYEDEHLIVIDKRAGLPVSAKKQASGKAQESVGSILSAYIRTQKRAGLKAGTSGHDAPSKVFILHRVDVNASGLMVMAKDERTRDLMLSKWNELVQLHSYKAVVSGRPEKSEGGISTWLKEDEGGGRVISSRTEKDGQLATTTYRLLQEGKKTSLMEFVPQSRRKHQIRVHASYELGTPIFGDSRYGSSESFKGKIALHSETLVIKNPYGGRIMEFHSPMPESFSKLIK